LPSNELCEFLDRGGVAGLLEYSHYRLSAASRDDAPETRITKVHTEKCIISIIWSISEIHSLFAFAKGPRSNSHHFCQQSIPDIHQRISSSSRRKSLQEIFLDFDNAPAHNSRLSSENIESAKAQRAPHPPSDPDQT
jgi:hypothetical protein